MKRLALFIISVLLLTSCGPKFEQVAYYKNDQTKFRVFVYVTEATDSPTLKKHAEKQAYTPGGTTAVYYYNSINTISLTATFATDAFDAQTRACQKDCIAGYWKFPTGKINFIENPYSE